MTQSPRQWARLSFLLMATLASAKPLTLSDFESIEAKQVASDCIKAYDTPLAGCTANDFVGGKACSASCKSSVKETEGYIKASCADAESDSNSLLYRGQKGNLVEVLCRDVDEIRESQPPQTSTVSSTLSTQVKENLMIETGVDVPTSTEDLRSGKTAVVKDSELTETSVLAIDMEEPTRSLPAATSAPAKTTAATKESESQQGTSQPGGGGGDPGDFVTSAASVRLPALSLVSAVLCVVFFA